MKHAIVTALIVLFAASGGLLAGEPEQIGVYDSRAIAIVWAKTDQFQSIIRTLKTLHKEAKNDGDTELADHLQAVGEGLQEKMHYQGFSTAPVDNILSRFKDPIAAAMEEAGVTVILSKWDEDGLARHPDAKRIDITAELVQAMEPKDFSLDFLKEIAAKPPVPLEELKKMLAEGHE